MVSFHSRRPPFCAPFGAPQTTLAPDLQQEPARAVTYLVHLADKVTRSYALEDAARVLHEALATTERVPPPPRRL